MRTTHRGLLIALVVLVAAPWPRAAQTTTTTTSDSVVLSPAEMEHFLLNAKVVKKGQMSKGVTKAQRVTLSDGRITHDAQIQDVDIYKALFEVTPKHTEVDFRDTYRYNIAAYRLAVQLGLDNVPMSVDRPVGGKPAAMTWWLDGVMDEGDRRKKKITTTNQRRTDEYYSRMKVFDELIQNRDRNAGNIVWTTDERMWMVDHTRAFRLGKELMLPNALNRIERPLLEKLRGLDRQALAAAAGKTLTKQELDALFVRRDLLVQLFDQRIATRGEAAFYTIQ